LVEVEVLLPKADPNMTEGKIIEWLKKEGDRVQAGETLANVETEKLEFPVESPASGMLKRVLVQQGDTVEISKLIAVIETEG
jgi:pyruvate/2-oxoglutarate dehydrogenase complex dihydrolipoamide acyltransferase (E2) component